ncbi:tetratricopeptide repeat protein [Micromonospora yangpuensis]|uniref:Tetratricopeptide repeat-containing protein n=2 Tax=Micromonospora yangpuensis TaxID=683228 RepID=A0A1C6UEF3_9ACTN|nr:tetratricopeptide repeat protein [Micromonospora yangpuensis]SCL52475.1 Tetratricopeptide repeat-containing protein [Micromonospora yangpuensis]
MVSDGDLHGARRLLADALADADPRPAYASPELAEAAGLQARVLVALGEPHSARGWAAFAYAVATRLYGRSDPQTISAAATLAAVLHRVGSDARAARLYADVIIELTATDGPESLRVLAAHADLATVEYARGQCTVARDRLQDAWELHREVYGDGHPSGIKMLARLGSMQRDCGRFTDAQENLTYADELCRQHLPPGDPLAAQVAKLARAVANPQHVCPDAEPTTPAEPATSAEPTTPTEPTTSAEPTSSAGPTTSAGPMSSAEPVTGPATSGEPELSDGPATSDGPALAHGAATSGSPAWSGGPATSGGPAVSGGPAWSGGPATSGGPAVSGGVSVPAAREPSVDEGRAEPGGPTAAERTPAPYPDSAATAATASAPSAVPAPRLPADDPDADWWPPEEGDHHADAAYPFDRPPADRTQPADATAPIDAAGQRATPFGPASPSEWGTPAESPVPPAVMALARSGEESPGVRRVRQPPEPEPEPPSRLLPVVVHRPPPPRPNRLVPVVVAGVLVVLLGAAAVIAGVSRVDDSRDDQPVPAGPSLSASAPPAPAATPGTPPGSVVLRDNRNDVLLRWRYPAGAEGPVVVAGGPTGQDPRAFTELPAGTETYTVYGLDRDVDFCFTVAVVWSTEKIGRSRPVCTERG